MACASQPMNGGDGEFSYTCNSNYQRDGIEKVRALIRESIQEKLDLNQIIASSPSSIFRIADLGCSVGPNTFIVIQNIIESVRLKFESTFPCEDQKLEFEVLFNDIPSNDFNTLFHSLPAERNYFLAGVPGRFHGRLFPRASVHFIHSSYALHWLSSIPRDLDVINKGSMSYHRSPKEVLKAYSTQFAKETMSFLVARAEEVVAGGIMAIILCSLPSGVVPTELKNFLVFDFMEASLLDMVKTGSISEEQLDSFNIPIYFPTPQEVASVVEKNDCFSIEKIESLVHPFVELEDEISIRRTVLRTRVLFEKLIRAHFGEVIVEEFYDRFSMKLEEYASGEQSNEKKKQGIDGFICCFEAQKFLN